jgi:hypothetical protein
MNDIHRLACRAFHMPKAGHTLAEYEDAFAGDPERGRFAIADGASESAFARRWARILVNAYVRTPGSWSLWLPGARRRWRSKYHCQELPWYAESKFAQGAFASLLGVAIAGQHWQAQAIGDSCLFHVRGHSLRRGFPVRRSDEFGNEPNLLGSRPRGNTQIMTKRIHLAGEWEPGDFLFLMTDALAQWFLKTIEDRGQLWKDLHALQTQAQFAQLLENLRDARQVRNDDVTFLRIQNQNP